jgi:NAD(P)-dependent dehydrogenase (short-subunit alcohol dehydrogenase family)
MTDYSSHQTFAAEVDKIVGEKGLTLLLQNAGVNVNESVEELKPETMVKIYEINSVSPILLTRELIPLLKRSVATGERTIAAFLSSLLGSVELNNQNKYIAYRMSKSALNQGVRTLVNAYPEGIEWVLLHPGKLLHLQKFN